MSALPPNSKERVSQWVHFAHVCNLFWQSLPGFTQACDPSSVGRENLKLVPVQCNPRSELGDGANTGPLAFLLPCPLYF